MRVLLDQQLDQRLRTLFPPEFRIETVRYRGWAGAGAGYEKSVASAARAAIRRCATGRA